MNLMQRLKLCTTAAGRRQLADERSKATSPGAVFPPAGASLGLGAGGLFPAPGCFPESKREPGRLGFMQSYPQAEKAVDELTRELTALGQPPPAVDAMPEDELKVGAAHQGFEQPGADRGSLLHLNARAQALFDRLEKAHAGATEATSTPVAPTALSGVARLKAAVEALRARRAVASPVVTRAPEVLPLSGVDLLEQTLRAREKAAVPENERPHGAGNAPAVEQLPFWWNDPHLSGQQLIEKTLLLRYRRERAEHVK